MLYVTDKMITKGSLVEIVCSPFVSARSHTETEVIRVDDLGYLYEVIDNPNRFWSIGHKTMGSMSGTNVRINVGLHGLCLGTVILFNPFSVTYHDGEPRLAVLLEKSVYIVPANCVKCVQATTTLKKVAKNG